MLKGIRLWVVWVLALTVGIYGTGLVYQGIMQQQWLRFGMGVPILLLGIWVTGNILASARQSYRREKLIRRHR